MVSADVIDLISTTYTSDGIGNQIPVEKKERRFCEVRSITQTEFYAAGQADLRPEHKFVIFRGDYDGQPELEYNGKRYLIYRTYTSESEETELYAGERVGV